MAVAAAPEGLEILDKAGRVLDALTSGSDLTASEIAEATGEPVSSTYRLLSSLQQVGWVQSGSRRGEFRLGVDALRIGTRLEDELDVRQAALPALRRLHDDTGLTAYLCIRRGLRAVCIERIEGRSVRSLALLLGESLPLYSGAAPLALFAHLPTSEQDACLSAFAGEEPGVHVDELRCELTAIRGRGYAISDGDVTPGIAALGAAAVNHRGELAGAVSVSGLRAQVLEEPGTEQLVVEAARRVSRALGWGA